MMNIQYISDTHFEVDYTLETFEQFLQALKRHAPILVCAGDIGNPFSPFYRRFVDHVSAMYDKVFIIAGNHEFYNTETGFAETTAQIREVVASYCNISFLDNSWCRYNGVTFYGTTLWTHISKPKYKTNDLVAIADCTVDKYNGMHAEAVSSLSAFLRTAHEPVIIISHHLPANNLILPQYRTWKHKKYHQWFASDIYHNSLDQAQRSKIALWIYGHTHTGSDIVHENTRFVCNPVGYIGENSARAVSDAVIKTVCLERP